MQTCKNEFARSHLLKLLGTQLEATGKATMHLHSSPGALWKLKAVKTMGKYANHPPLLIFKSKTV